jgi:hypothetical protein
VPVSFTDVENISLLENHLQRKDSRKPEALNLRFAPRPRITLDYKKWSLLPRADQDTLLDHAIDFLREFPSTDFKLDFENGFQNRTR